MILPGNVFFKRDQLNSKSYIHVGFVLMALNLFVYLFFTLSDSIAEKKMLKLVTQNHSLEIKTLRTMYQQVTDPLSLGFADSHSLTFLRDSNFRRQAERFPFQGDVIEIEKNKKILFQISELYNNSKQYQFGLSQEATAPWAWVTYQFTHAGFIHLFTNMIFLILITNILIKRVQSEWIVLTYIIGGIGAGIFYLALSNGNDIAMVGASGSLCALISFVCVVVNKKNIQWSYFISPISGSSGAGYGIMYMPAFLLFPVYLISDFTSVLYTTNGTGASIAHSAHIGGALTGFVLGFTYLLIQFFRSKASAHGVLGDDDRFHELL